MLTFFKGGLIDVNIQCSPITALWVSGEAIFKEERRRGNWGWRGMDFCWRELDLLGEKWSGWAGLPLSWVGYMMGEQRSGGAEEFGSSWCFRWYDDLNLNFFVETLRNGWLLFPNCNTCLNITVEIYKQPFPRRLNDDGWLTGLWNSETLVTFVGFNLGLLISSCILPSSFPTKGLYAFSVQSYAYLPSTLRSSWASEVPHSVFSVT